MGMEDFPKPQEEDLEPEPGSGEAGEVSPEQVEAYKQISVQEEQFANDMRVAENEPGVIQEYMQMWREEHARRKADEKDGIIAGSAKLGTGVVGAAGFLVGGVPGAALGAGAGAVGGAAFGLGLTALRESAFLGLVAGEHAVRYGKKKVESAKALVRRWRGGGEQGPAAVA
jgi:hypothetical protein